MMESQTGTEDDNRLSPDKTKDVHSRRTLYLVRHGEAVHNVLEKRAQQEAKQEAEALNLSSEETHARMEEARQAVLQDPSLRDAPLTDQGRQEARECGQRLQKLIDDEHIGHPPTEAMVSPLTRTLETCKIILDTTSAFKTKPLKAQIREEIKERQTWYPPDTPHPHEQLFRYTQTNDRFVMDHIEKVSAQDVRQEIMVRESKEMLRERASKLFDLLLKMNHRHILIVSHKGYLRELERGLLRMPNSPLFENGEMRIYRVVFTRGERSLESIERLA